MPGGYLVEAVLEADARGRVLLARKPDGARVRIREVALAFVSDLSVVEAFEKESRLLAQLSHPAFPRLITSFREGEGERHCLYAVEAHVEAEPLQAYLARVQVTEAVIEDIAEQVLDALVYLQSVSPAIYHRDIRPRTLARTPNGRILFTRLSTARDLSVTGAFTVVGHVRFTAPEQRQGIVDKTTDPYGLGATLAHALPAAASISPQLKLWIDRLTAPKPRDRFADAAAARAALRALAPDLRPRAPRMLWVAAAALAVLGFLLAIAPSRVEPPPTPTPVPGVIQRHEDPVVEIEPVDDDPPPPPKKPKRKPKRRRGDILIPVSPWEVWGQERLKWKTHEMNRWAELVSWSDMPAAIKVTSSPPGAVIEFNGRRVRTLRGHVAKTPTVLHRFRPGQLVELRLYRTGHAPRFVQITTRPRPDHAHVHVRFDALAPDPPCNPSDDGRDGIVSLKSKPLANIYRGDEHIGRTPLSQITLPTGCVQLRVVSLDGTKSKQIRVRAHPLGAVYSIDL